MNFSKALSIYTITSIVNAGIPFFLLPVLTSYLSVEEYGLLAIIQVFIIFTIPFISINIQSTLQLEYHDLDKKEFALWVSSVLVIPLITIFGIIVAFIVFESLISRFINLSTLWILLIPMIAFMQIIPQVVLSIYKIKEEPLNYGKYQLFLTFVNLVLTLIFVILFNLNWQGRLEAIFLSYALFTFLGIFYLYKMKLIVFHIKMSYIQKALKLGTPLIIHVISGVLFMMSDRLFISYYLGNEELGIYSVGAQVAMIAMIIQQSFNQAWVPYFFKNLKIGKLENKIKIIKISYLAILFFILLPFIIELINPLLFHFFIDDKFSAAIIYVFWISVGYSFLGMYKVVTNYIFYEKRVKLLSLMTFTSLILNLILNYIFIHRYGSIGVAYATALTVAFFFIIAFILANYVHKMPWLYFLNKGK